MAFLNISASGPFTMPGDGRGNFYSKAMAQLEYTHAVGGALSLAVLSIALLVVGDSY